MIKYHEVFMAGVSCYADAAIVDDDYVYMISLYGRPGTVKSIGAGILSGRLIFVADFHVSRHPDYSLRAVTQTIEKGLCHKIIFSPDHFIGPDKRILIGEDKDAAFNLLDAAVSTPLKADWADFLWNRLYYPQPLYGFGQLRGKNLSDVYMVTIDKTTEEVDALILEETESGVLQ